MAILVPSRAGLSRGGFTLIEVIISAAVFSILFLAAYGSLTVAVETQTAGTRRVDLQSYGIRALRDIVGELKQTGRVDLSPPSDRIYPYFFTNGAATGYFASYTHAVPTNFATPGTMATGASSEIIYLLPRDLDGDGTRVNAVTGVIEWGPENWSIVLVPQSNGPNALEIRKNGVTERVLARHVNRILLEDYRTDSSLGISQVRIRIWMVYKGDKVAKYVETMVGTIINMRNIVQ